MDTNETKNKSQLEEYNRIQELEANYWRRREAKLVYWVYELLGSGAQKLVAERLGVSPSTIRVSYPLNKNKSHLINHPDNSGGFSNSNTKGGEK